MPALFMVFFITIGQAIPISPSPQNPTFAPTLAPSPAVRPQPPSPPRPAAPYGTCATPITKANVGALIDPEIPNWMRKEIEILILNMVARTGCFRGDIASEDKNGRFITSSIAALRAHQRETAGVWHQQDAHTWISPSGDQVPMEDVVTPRALLGHWHCTDEYGTPATSYYFGPNHRGRAYANQRILNFIYEYEVPQHDLYFGFGHGQGTAQRIAVGDRSLAMIFWGYYHEWQWTPMSTQDLLTCSKAVSGFPLHGRKAGALV